MGVGALIGGSLLSGAVGAFSSSRAAKAQERGAQSAAAAQVYATDRTVDEQRAAREQAERLFVEGRDRASGLYDEGFIWQSGEIDGGYAAAENDLRGGYAGARESLSPYSAAGRNALAGLQYELGLSDQPSGYAGFMDTPWYQFRLAEGQKAMERNASARGLRLSSGQMKDAMRFGQGLASEEYGNYLNRLSGMTDMGFTADRGISGLREAEGRNLAGLRTARASDRVAAIGARTGNLANAALGAASNTASAYGTAAGSIGNALMQGARGAGNAYMAAGDARAGGALGINNALQGTMGNLTSIWMMNQMGAFGQPGGGMSGMGTR